MNHVKEMKGRTFGRLYVRCFHKMIRFGSRLRAVWKCDCSCGARFYAVGERLVAGKTKSCGCLRRDMGKQTIDRVRLAMRAQAANDNRSWTEVAEAMG